MISVFFLLSHRTAFVVCYCKFHECVCNIMFGVDVLHTVVHMTDCIGQ